MLNLHEETDAGSPLTLLKSLVGLPARIWLEEAAAPGQVIKVPGMLTQVFTTGISMDLIFPLTHPRTDTAVVLEVVARTALYQFHSVIHHSDSPQRVHLQLPEQMHIVQRRNAPRATVLLQAVLVKPNGSGLPGRVINLSEGGAAVLTTESVPVGTSLRITLQVLGATEIDLTGQVARCTLSPNGTSTIGIRFIHLSHIQEQWLQQYVAHALQTGP